jgi:hypothetical protein
MWYARVPEVSEIAGFDPTGPPYVVFGVPVTYSDAYIAAIVAYRNRRSQGVWRCRPNSTAAPAATSTASLVAASVLAATSSTCGAGDAAVSGHS